MKGLILFIVAKVLIILFYPIGFIYSIILTWIKSGWKSVDNYFFECAVADDQSANTYLAKFFNDILKKIGGSHFGNTDETISSVLGKNQLSNKLTFVGKVLNWILNKFEKDHSIKSIGK